MYGTIARFRIKPGVKNDFIQAMDGLGDAVVADGEHADLQGGTRAPQAR